MSDLSWLLEKGYADRSALKLVGDRYRLRQRQRTADRRFRRHMPGHQPVRRP